MVRVRVRVRVNTSFNQRTSCDSEFYNTKANWRDRDYSNGRSTCSLVVLILYGVVVIAHTHCVINHTLWFESFSLWRWVRVGIRVRARVRVRMTITQY